MKYKEEKIVEINTLIAKFMGVKVIDEYPETLLLDFIHKDNYPDNGRYHSNTCLKYHKEFNWLMPVLFKCEKHGLNLVYARGVINACRIKFKSGEIIGATREIIEVDDGPTIYEAVYNNEDLLEHIYYTVYEFLLMLKDDKKYSESMGVDYGTLA